MPRFAPHDRLLAARTWLVAACLGAASAAAPGASVELQSLGSDGKLLPGAVFFLDSKEAKAASKPLGNVEVAQSERRFVQRVTVVTTGSLVNFPNRDKVRHHVYSFSPTKTFELKLFAGTPANPVAFDKPGIAVLGCNIHDSMVGWVVVVETPFHGTADAKGQLRLDNVPPGSYRLRSWHPGLPPGTQPSDVALVVPAAGVQATSTLPLVGSAL